LDVVVENTFQVERFEHIGVELRVQKAGANLASQTHIFDCDRDTFLRNKERTSP
jgi:hypothetical protein